MFRADKISDNLNNSAKQVYEKILFLQLKDMSVYLFMEIDQ